MIIEFSVGNFRSFEETETFSMVAADLAGHELEDTHVAKVGNRRLLRSAAIYGANASGKSNFVFAFQVFGQLTRRSSSLNQEGDKLPVVPFLLRKDAQKSPSLFELVFLMGGKKFRYGFEVTREKVISEWLFSQTSSRETRLFTRTGQNIDVNSRSFAEGVGKESSTRTNALFLSLCAQLNGKVSREIMQQIVSTLVLNGLQDKTSETYTTFRLSLEENEQHPKVVGFLRKLDLCFEDVKVEGKEAKSVMDFEDEVTLHEELDGLLKKPPRISLMHPVYDASEKRVGEQAIDLRGGASEGTRKLFGLAGPIVDALTYGSTLFIDEMDARLHPLVTRNLVALFNSPETNPNNAQLIFTTHDTNLLDPKLLRRDQIWFAEKDRVGATHLYSLAEFRQEDGTLPRPNANFEDQYIQGRYGAIPFLGDFAALFPTVETPVAVGAETDG